MEPPPTEARQCPDGRVSREGGGEGGSPEGGVGGGGCCPPPTRWGICSAGHISHDFAVALKTLPPEEHVALAVAARELPRAQAFALRHGLPRAYGSYRELAQDPDVDVVYVGTVNTQHLAAGRLFLAAGKAVLMEKPMAVGAGEVRELVEAARARGVFLMEGFWTRFFPAWGRLRALVAGGALGEPRLLRGGLAFALGDVERLREPGLAGGALLDLGGYGLQMALALMGGGPQRLRATGCLHPTGVDETVTMTLEFEGNRLAVLSCSMAAEMPGGAALGGTRGWAEFPSHMNCPTELVVGGRRELFPLPPPSQPLNFPHGTGLRYEAQHVRECLLRGLTESPVMPLAESELIARLLDEARRQVGAAGPRGAEAGGAEGAPSPTE
ncbi:trans-1,2-dihydrobenzene-1,2-diol dehydrogenase [Larus michahellis]|uniref:trans-1,2-dihydrobenzene-1,2-diol dehydrogenase n=1 Tax=Larus michahellis TaxID=119627 RepID=UPI003D9BDEE1